MFLLLCDLGFCIGSIILELPSVGAAQGRAHVLHIMLRQVRSVREMSNMIKGADAEDCVLQRPDACCRSEQEDV